MQKGPEVVKQIYVGATVDALIKRVEFVERWGGFRFGMSGERIGQ